MGLAATQNATRAVTATPILADCGRAEVNMPATAHEATTANRKSHSRISALCPYGMFDECGVG